jgi:hypothetical protein
MSAFDPLQTLAMSDVVYCCRVAFRHFQQMRRLKFGKLIAVVGWTICTGPILSEGQLESKVSTSAKYSHRSEARQNAIDVHGRRFYVGEHDLWRSRLTVYLIFVGGLIIWAGWRVQGRNV